MRKLLIGFLLLLTMIFAVVPVASAVDFREGTRNTVAKGETVDDDLALFGDSISIDGTVNGDVFAFGNTVTVRGTINGNLITAASRVEVEGAVTGTLFGAGDKVYVSGRVDRSLVAAGSQVELDATAAVGHSVIAAADRISQRGTVGRGMVLGANRIDLNGKVGKEVRAGVNDLFIGANATIAGPVEYHSDHQATIDPAARTGEVTYTYANVDWNHNATFWFSGLWHVFSFVGFVAFGLAILALFPALRRSFPRLVLEKPWQLPVTGLVTLVIFPIAAIVLLLTVVGIPVSFVSMFALPVLIYVGQVLVSYTVGSLLGERVPFMANWNWAALFLVGAVLTTAAVATPGAGWIFGLGFVLYGLGGLLWLIFVRRPAA